MTTYDNPIYNGGDCGCTSAWLAAVADAEHDCEGVSCLLASYQAATVSPPPVRPPPTREAAADELGDDFETAISLARSHAQDRLAATWDVVNI